MSEKLLDSRFVLLTGGDGCRVCDSCGFEGDVSSVLLFVESGVSEGL